MKKWLFILFIVSLNVFSQEKTDSLFTGFKIEYYNNKNPKKKVEYRLGKPSGLTVTYHPSGAINEVGVFMNGRWIGNYKLHFPNGNIQQNLNFDVSGKRIGVQKYYYSGGVIKTISNFYNGKGNDFSLSFDSLGKVVSSTLFLDGIKISEDDKLYANYKEMLGTMIELVRLENETIAKPK